MDNTGSFGSAAGGMSPELQAAISRRAGGNPSGPMGQTTNSAPTNDPTIQQPQIQPSQVNPASVGVPSSPRLSGGAGLPINVPEAQLIIKALDSRLKSISKQEEGGVL